MTNQRNPIEYEYELRSNMEFIAYTLRFEIIKTVTCYFAYIRCYWNCQDKTSARHQSTNSNRPRFANTRGMFRLASIFQMRLLRKYICVTYKNGTLKCKLMYKYTFLEVWLHKSHCRKTVLFGKWKTLMCTRLITVK